MKDRNVRLVYSSDRGRYCQECGSPESECECSLNASNAPVPSRVVAKLRLEKKGRGGKAVTVLYDLPRNAAFLRELCQELKRACGTGGSVLDDTVQIQGDLRQRVRQLLAERGFLVKG